MAALTPDEIEQIYEEIEQHGQEINYATLLRDLKKELIKEGLSMPRVPKRKLPTQTELARYHAVRGISECMGCYKIRPSKCFMQDGTCWWCHGDVTDEAKAEIEDDKLFVRSFEKRYIKKKESKS
jgi:hypothetical protein